MALFLFSPSALRRLRLFAVLLPLLAAPLLFFVVRGIDRPVRAPAEPAPQTGPTAPAEEPTPATPPLTPEEEARLPQMPTGCAHPVRPDEPAITVRGTLLAPSGSPADPSLRVVLVDSGKTSEEAAESVLYDYGYDDTARARAFVEALPRRLAEAPVAADGSFDLEVPASVRRGWIDVDGAWLYLDAPLPWDEAVAARPVLRPRLGACVSGSLAVTDGAPATPLGGRFVLLRADWRDVGHALEGKSPPARAWVTSVDGHYELRGIRAGRYVLLAGARGLAPAVVENLWLHPSERLQVDLPLRQGATVRGRVTLESGQPDAAARVAAAGSLLYPAVNDLYFPLLEPDDRTAADGSFELLGVPPGHVTIRTGTPPCVDTQEVELARGQAREDVHLVRHLGGTVRGRVSRLDGQPVAGATVVATPTAREGATRPGPDRSGKTTTARDGSFELSCLAGERFGLQADIRAPDGSVGNGTAESVPLGAEDVQIVVHFGFAVEGTVAVDGGGGRVPRYTVRYASLDAPESFADGPQVAAGQDRFTLGGLAPGGWRVRLDTPLGSSEAEDVKLTPTQRVAKVSFTLKPAADLAVRVVSPDGDPVPGANVVSFQRDDRVVSDPTGWSAPAPELLGPERQQSPRTDARGVVHLPADGLAGRSLVATCERSAAPLAPSAELHLPDPLPQEIELQLRPGGTLVGTAWNSDGRVAAGAIVQARNREGWPESTATDDQGRFRLAGLAAGDWRLFERPGDGTPRTVATAEGTVVAGEESEVQLGAPVVEHVMLEGRVLLGKVPAQRQLLFLADASGSPASAPEGKTDPAGHYQLDLAGQRAGWLVVRDGRQIERTLLVEVPPGESLHHLDVVLPAGELRGRVLGPNNAPAQGALLLLAAESGAGFFGAPALALQTSDESGGFTFAGLEAGGYTLYAAPSAHDPAIAVREGIVLDGERPLDVEVRLPAGGTLDGTLHDAAGQPVPEARLLLLDADSRVLTPWPVETRGGTFQLAGLAQGSYRLVARAPGLASEPSAPVTVAPGATAKCDLVLSPAAPLRVETVRMDGKPVAAEVAVLDATGRPVPRARGERVLETLPPGAESFGPLLPGEYRVVATLPSGEEARDEVHLDGDLERTLRLMLAD